MRKADSDLPIFNAEIWNSSKLRSVMRYQNQIIRYGNRSYEVIQRAYGSTLLFQMTAYPAIYRGSAIIKWK